MARRRVYTESWINVNRNCHFPQKYLTHEEMVKKEKKERGVRERAWRRAEACATCTYADKDAWPATAAKRLRAPEGGCNFF